MFFLPGELSSILRNHARKDRLVAHICYHSTSNAEIASQDNSASSRQSRDCLKKYGENFLRVTLETDFTFVHVNIFVYPNTVMHTHSTETSTNSSPLRTWTFLVIASFSVNLVHVGSQRRDFVLQIVLE